MCGGFGFTHEGNSALAFLALPEACPFVPFFCGGEDADEASDFGAAFDEEFGGFDVAFECGGVADDDAFECGSVSF